MSVESKAELINENKNGVEIKARKRRDPTNSTIEEEE